MTGGDRVGIQNTMRALADPTRRTILNLLKKNSLAAGEIAEHFEMSMPAVSKHLAVLKEADLIRDRREGKYIYYELNASVLDEALLWLTELRGE
jgi:DNA-binding transcriptional ArsR family regulator